MYRLLKIKELKSYRFFQDYKWDEDNCKLFSRYNIIYGWNGSGKTTLCDFLRDLERSELTEEGAKTSLLFEDTNESSNKVITHTQLATSPALFKVFHKQYISETISEVDKIKHIFTLGTGQRERIDELNDLKRQQRETESHLKVLEGQYSTLNTQFEQQKTQKASQIKTTANYSGAYNKNKFYQAYQELKTPALLEDDEYQVALTEIRTEKKDLILMPEFDFLKDSVKVYISSLLTNSPVNTAIDDLQNDSAVNTWVETGLSLHDERETETCLFCGNPIGAERLDALRAHFNKSYKELSDKIDSAKSLLITRKQHLNAVLASLPDSGLLYGELRQKYDELLVTAQELVENNSNCLDAIVRILDSKKSDMINADYVTAFENEIAKYIFDNSIFDSIIDIIKTHNSKSADFQKCILSAQQKVERHLISQFAAEIKSMEFELNKSRDEINVHKESIRKLAEKITVLEQEVRNSRIPAERINADIEFIIGRNELVFENKPVGYQILRNGQIANNLSKGEENAIALIYFFNSLADMDVDITNTIVVLDDPISSFDSNFYYNAISYIRDKTSAAGQVFVFTHKFSLLKDYSLMYRGETNRYMLKRESNTPRLINEDNMLSQYYDEYAYLFKLVYLFVKHPPDNIGDYFQYPNVARRLLEGFLTFKMPNDDSLIDKVLLLDGDENTAAGRAMLRLLNNRSHFRVIPDSEGVEDTTNIATLPNTMQFLMQFIETHDKKHYDALVSRCDPHGVDDSDTALCSDSPERVVRTIKRFDMPVSAGFGNRLEDDEPYTDFETDNQDADYALSISGDSMEPDIPNGSIILVKKAEEVPNAKVGVFFFDGESYCKKKIENNGELFLVSVNKRYPVMRVSEDSVFKILGEVIDVIPD